MSPHLLFGQMGVGQMGVGQVGVGQVSRIRDNQIFCDSVKTTYFEKRFDWGLLRPTFGRICVDLVILRCGRTVTALSCDICMSHFRSPVLLTQSADPGGLGYNRSPAPLCCLKEVIHGESWLNKPQILTQRKSQLLNYALTLTHLDMYIHVIMTIRWWGQKYLTQWIHDWAFVF